MHKAKNEIIGNRMGHILRGVYENNGLYDFVFLSSVICGLLSASGDDTAADMFFNATIGSLSDDERGDSEIPYFS